MEGERRGWVIQLTAATNQQWEESMTSTKPFSIAKQAVWEAYKQVKANHGAAGVDAESIEEFEGNLKDNLYKLWNRLSSGSYFPPPVKVVAIAKKDGGQRQLGIPTVADRIAQGKLTRLRPPHPPTQEEKPAVLQHRSSSSSTLAPQNPQLVRA